jgi:DNA helicase-2/ATP-dependent DNA helicase PcrA
MAYYKKPAGNNNWNNYKKPVKPANPTRVVMDWSAYQTAVFSDVENGTGNTQISAVAGSGKTTTLVESFYHVPSNATIGAFAFNKKIQIEWESRSPARANCLTMHAMGLRTIKKVFPRAVIDNDKAAGYIKAEYGDEKDTWEFRSELERAVALSKLTLSSSFAEIDEMLDKYDIETGSLSRDEFISSTQDIVETTKNDTNRIDFNDMIWFPLVHGMKPDKYDFVFADEVQDFNKCQTELVLSTVAPGGRIITCGDSAQAIYGWIGADSNSIDNIVRRLNSKTLNLSVCYRCAKSIIELAQTYNSEIEYAPSAEEGQVIDISKSKIVETAKAGDFIISRTNAPLVSLCFEMIKQGIPCNIAGREIGKGLLFMIKKSKAENIIEFLDWVTKWRDNEVMRFSAMNRNFDHVNDKAECLIAFCEHAFTLSDVEANIRKMFDDVDDNKKVILTSTHKAKGLERDRAILLWGTYKPEKGQEEKNLAYVAITRAKKTLIIAR